MPPFLASCAQTEKYLPRFTSSTFPKPKSAARLVFGAD